MLQRGARTITFRTGLFLLGFVNGFVLITTDEVHAQGLFDAFIRLFGGSLSQPPVDKKVDGPAVAYCVRLCDGHYFPIAKNAGASNSSPEKICSALCPASPTKVYTGNEISQASAVDGSSYSKLENAFVYREKMIQNCTCTGKDIGGIVAMDIHSDPTLRSGDIVATKYGLMVFKGSKQLPYQTSDFIPAEDYKALPAGVRRTLAELKVAPEPIRADQDITIFSNPDPESPQLSTFASRTLYPRDTPVADADPLFAIPMF